MGKSAIEKSFNSLVKKMKIDAKGTHQKLFQNKVIIWGVRGLLVVYAVFFAPHLSEGAAELFDNILFRFLMAAIIVYLSFVDPALAILLAIGFIISIMTLNKYKVAEIASEASQQQRQEQEELEETRRSHGIPSEQVPGMLYQAGGNVAEETQQPQQPQQPQQGEGGLEQFRGEGGQFTTAADLKDAQSNVVGSESNYNTGIKAFRNEMGPQGLSPIQGYNPESAKMI